MKLCWATDIHLNFLETEGLARLWCQGQLLRGDPDAVVITGDIAEAEDVEGWLVLLEEELQRPVYFVLGNHDFYRGRIAEVRARMRALSERSEHLQWMNSAGVVPLTERTALIGHDGWSDARCGDFHGSTIRLNDYRLIEDLADLTGEALEQKLNALGDEAAAHVAAALDEALARFEQVVLLIHPPPFQEACWHEDRTSDDNWAPHMTCKAVGDVLLERMASRPERTLTVLAGHTHSAGETWVLPNLHVRTGRAEYGAPEVQTSILVP